MKDDEHLTILEKAALEEKRYRRSRIIDSVIFGAYWILLIVGMLLIGYLKGFI
jgi:hypothetical protein